MAMNPKWSVEEIILVYDLYLANGRRSHSVRHPDLLALSDSLRALPWHARAVRNSAFRNATGTATKMQQIRAYERQDVPKGMSSHSDIKTLTDRFRDDPAGVHDWARAIRAAVDAEQAFMPDDQQEEPEATFTEGKVTFGLHRRLERNPQARLAKLTAVHLQTGHLACEVCGFDFERVFGEHGRGFAECHHQCPLGSTPGPRETRLDDLALVCANCHRMLHRRLPDGKLPTVVQLRGMLERRSM